MLVLTLLRLSSRCASGFCVTRSSLKSDRVVSPRSVVLLSAPDLFLGPLLRTAPRDQPPGPSAFLSTRVLFFYPECFSVKSTQSLKFRPAFTRVTSSDITLSLSESADLGVDLLPPDLPFSAFYLAGLRLQLNRLSFRSLNPDLQF